MAEHLALALSLIAIAGLAWRWPRGFALRPEPLVLPASLASPLHGEAAMLEILCQDIRARTSGMVGLAEQLVGAPLAEDQQHQAELIADSGRTMIRLLGDVLDVTRIDAAGLQLLAEPTDLREVLDHHVNLMRASARTRGLALSLMVDDAVPPQVVLDRTRLRQVLLNLVGNAVKFTQRGTIEVQARVAQTAGGSQLAISVIDSGIGIARERQAAIFQPFFRHEVGTAPSGRTTSGTGLGLALASRIVNAMGGEIALESAPGLGSCFTVRLPMVVAGTDYDPTSYSPERGCESVPEPGQVALSPGLAQLCDLEERYNRRKDSLFASLQAALSTPPQRAAETDWTAIASQLHRLAGVAANFDNARLGDLARHLHDQFRAQANAHQRHALLAENWDALQAER